MPGWIAWTTAALAAFVVVIALATAVLAVTRLRRAGRGARSSLAGFDLQMRLRAEAVIDLVTAVRGVAEHERGILAEAEAAHDQASRSCETDSIDERAAARARLDGSVRDLLAITEAYPDLTASEAFRAVRGRLLEAERMADVAAGEYDTQARRSNAVLRTSPWRHLAGLAGVRERALLAGAAEPDPARA